MGITRCIFPPCITCFILRYNLFLLTNSLNRLKKTWIVFVSEERGSQAAPTLPTDSVDVSSNMCLKRVSASLVLLGSSQGSRRSSTLSMWSLWNLGAHQIHYQVQKQISWHSKRHGYQCKSSSILLCILNPNISEMISRWKIFYNPLNRYPHSL